MTCANSYSDGLAWTARHAPEAVHLVPLPGERQGVPPWDPLVAVRTVPFAAPHRYARARRDPVDNYRAYRCFTCGEYGHLKRECPNGIQKTYRAEIEDSAGHPMAIRVNVGIIPTARPPCQHRACATPDGQVHHPR